MPSKEYTNPETPIVFKDSGGTATLTLKNLAYGAARVSARYDKGAGAKCSLYRVIGVFEFDTAPVQGETIEVYVIPSDGTSPAGNVGTDDAALDVDQVRNFGPPVCIVVAEEAAADDTFIGYGMAYIPDRYLSVAVYNRSAGDNLRNEAATLHSFVTLIPMPPEMQ